MTQVRLSELQKCKEDSFKIQLRKIEERKPILLLNYLVILENKILANEQKIKGLETKIEELSYNQKNKQQ